MSVSRVWTFLGNVYLAMVCPVVIFWHRLFRTRQYREYREMMDTWLGK